MYEKENLQNMLNDVEKYVCKGNCDMDGGCGVGDICVFACPFYSLMYKLNRMNEKDELGKFIGGK